MTVITLPAWDDERIFISVEVPRNTGTVLTVKLPRMEFVSEQTSRQITAAIDKIAEESITANVRVKRQGLAMVKPFVTATELKAFEQLTPGHFTYLLEQWQKNSGVSLGELPASESSSTSIRGQSNTTSSSVVGIGGTSDEPSAG